MNLERKSQWKAGFRFTQSEIGIIGFLVLCLSTAMLRYRWPGHPLSDFAFSSALADLMVMMIPPRPSGRRLLRLLSLSAGCVLLFGVYLHFNR
jgi:hypothetical protein